MESASISYVSNLILMAQESKRKHPFRPKFLLVHTIGTSDFWYVIGRSIQTFFHFSFDSPMWEGVVHLIDEKVRIWLLLIPISLSGVVICWRSLCMHGLWLPVPTLGRWKMRGVLHVAGWVRLLWKLALPSDGSEDLNVMVWWGVGGGGSTRKPILPFYHQI